MTRRAVFLDRDGVLNRALLRAGRPVPPSSVAELEITPGAREALAELRADGFLLIVVTNQPDVARGRQTRETVELINARLKEQLPLDEIRVCYHDDGDGCACRKPLPGMLREAAAEHGISLEQSFMVGDRWRDIEAGERAGTRTVFIDNHYKERRPAGAHVEVPTLADAARWILTQGEMSPGATGKGERMRLTELKIKIFADGADKAGMLEMYRQPYIRGFTTNPTLMRKAGIGDYRAFARDIVRAIPDRPISFEVFSDEFAEMEKQAREISTWGEHVYVKIPITNTRRESSAPLIRRLSQAGTKLNVTAMMTLEQVKQVADSVSPDVPCYVSVFAGRIADTGRDPVPLMAAAVEILRPLPRAELIWASPREFLNIFQADKIGCHIITVTNDLLKKVSKIDYDLAQYSLDTVRMFYEDAQKAGFSL
jgi:transaldolase